MCVFQLILVFICDRFFLSSFLSWMIFLHSSSHHSFIGGLLCVCITSLAAQLLLSLSFPIHHLFLA
jgi:hypothetical protein